MKKFCQVVISAETYKDAEIISDHLLKKKLIAGSMIIKGPSKFWWKGKIVSMQYYNVSAYTVSNNKKKIVSETEEVSKEEVPIVAFYNLDGNRKFLEWIENSLK